MNNRQDKQVQALIKQFSLDGGVSTREGLKKVFQSPDTALRRRKLLPLLQKQPELYEATKDLADGLERIEQLVSLVLQPKIENPSVYFNHPENYDPLYLVDLWDDFVAGSRIESGEIGSLGWTLGAGTISIGTPTQSHPGIISVSSTNVNGVIGRICLGAGVSDYIFHSGDLNRILALVMLIDGTNVRYRFGAGQSSSSATFGTDGIYFETTFVAGVANWHCICRAGGVATDVDSGVSATIQVWWKLEIIQRDDGEIDFWINNDLVASINTNVPSVAMITAFHAHTTAAAIKSINVDFFRMQLKKLTDNVDARWP